MAEGPKFGAFVRAVEGHCVPRYGTAEYLGCSRGPKGFEWDTERVIPLLEDYCRKYTRELKQHIDAGELVACSSTEYMDYQEEQEIRAALENKTTSEGTTNEEPTK
jgi:hypothetical protein